MALVLCHTDLLHPAQLLLLIPREVHLQVAFPRVGFRQAVLSVLELLSHIPPAACQWDQRKAVMGGDQVHPTALTSLVASLANGQASTRTDLEDLMNTHRKVPVR